MLTSHPNGQWSKKIRGKVYYFGTDKTKAVARYLKVKDYLEAGLEPPKENVTVREIANQFLLAKQSLIGAEFSRVTWVKYRSVLKTTVEVIGEKSVDSLMPVDFARVRVALSERFGAISLSDAVGRTRTMFKWAYDSRAIEKPVWFGKEFERPSQRVIRSERNKIGEKMFTSDEIRLLLANATPKVKAYILLGINCAFGPTDIAMLTADLIQGDWIHYPRPKTGVLRCCPLWPETVDALKICHKTGLALTTRCGHPLVRQSENDAHMDMVTTQFSRLRKKVGITRKGLGFYSLRRTFRTVADEVRDPHAIDLIMGHANETMGRRYTQRISDERLLAVSNYVRDWLNYKRFNVESSRSSQ